MTKEVPVQCVTRDGMEIMLPEDVVAVLDLMGYEMYFGRTFCDVELRDAGEDLMVVMGFTGNGKEFDWKYDLIRWARDGMPEGWKQNES